MSLNTSLVICPNHLLAQWTSEIEKHTEPKLKVLPIPTMAQLKKYTYQQVLDADVVIVTYTMLIAASISNIVLVFYCVLNHKSNDSYGFCLSLSLRTTNSLILVRLGLFFCSCHRIYDLQLANYENPDRFVSQPNFRPILLEMKNGFTKFRKKRTYPLKARD